MMKKIYFLFIFCSLLSLSIKAQKQGNIWYYPQNGGIDFSTGNAVPIADGQAFDSEGCWSRIMEFCIS